jgi:pimeloyl-ACP methyl ester carboxylesterase
MVLMLYSAMLKTVYRALYGVLPEPTEGDESGLVLVADGVGGLELLGTALSHVVPSEGLPHVVRIAKWGHGLGRWHADLTRVENHVARAAEIAATVEEFRARKPDAPAFLVGKSGGTGLVVRVLESLPEDSIEAAVLVSPAISPSYDLTRALRAVRREMVVFWSPLDLIVLGLGTRIFGTIDRVNAVSAGLVGFRPPEALDEEGRAQYAKLRQERWRPGMASTGYLGGHIGPDSPAFLRRYVVPLLTAGGAENPGAGQAGRAPRR